MASEEQVGPVRQSVETARTQKRCDRQATLFDLMEAPLELLAFNRLRRRLWSEVHGARVLEVGVGTGKNISYHPDDARSVVIDLCPHMLRRAASRTRRLGGEVDLVLADAQHLPFRDDAFDSAADTFVFCSVPDPIAGLEEVRRVVRDEGRMQPPPSSPPRANPLEIAKERYARGDVDRDQFEQIKRDPDGLTVAHPRPPRARAR